MNLDIDHIVENLDLNVLIVGGVGVLVIIVLIAVLRFMVGRSVRPLVKWKPELQETAETLSSNLKLLLRLVGMALVLADLALTAYVVWKGKSLGYATSYALGLISPGFWVSLGVGVGKSLALVLVLRWALKWIDLGLEKLQEKAMEFEGVRSNDEAITVAFDLLQRMIIRSSWIAAWAHVSQWLLMPGSVHGLLMLALRIYLITMVGLLVWRTLDAVIESLNALSRKYASTHRLIRFYDALAGLIPVFRRSVEYVIYVSVATMVVHQSNSSNPWPSGDPASSRSSASPSSPGW